MPTDEHKYLTKNIVKQILAIFLLVAIIFMSGSCASQSERGKSEFAKGVENYNTSYYPVSSPFPAELPTDAKVIDYYWRFDSSKRRDRYLELLFDDKESLQQFLEQIINETKEYHSLVDSTTKDESDLFFYEQNPYDNSFVDCIYLPYHNWLEGQRYTGYYWCGDGTNGNVRIDFCCISYSEESRTVIVSLSSGVYNGDEGLIPAYFKRFSVPMADRVERVYIVE